MDNYSKGAVISDCGKYRYLLERHWDEGLGSVCFVMLNPSTADAYVDDPTIRRCVNFAKAWGYSSLYVVNLVAWRSSSPKEIPTDPDLAMGPHRDHFLGQIPLLCDQIIWAWGASLPKFMDKRFQQRVTNQLRPMTYLPRCLGFTKDGHPRHPLYLTRDVKLEAV